MMLKAVTNESDIVFNGEKLTDLMVELDFVDMWMLLHLERRPTGPEKRLMNTLLVSLIDHGITPTTIAARMTILSAPESIQGAVAAGILGAGNRFLGVTENVTRALYDIGYEIGMAVDADWIDKAATRLVDRSKIVLGVGHNIHREVDPRVRAVEERAEALGFDLTPWKILHRAAALLSESRETVFSVNNAGAVGAAVAALGFEPEFARGLSVVARSAGLVVHALDEKKKLPAKELWERLVHEENMNQEGEKK